MESDLAGHASLEGVDEAPCYYPTAAQFAEPLEYIASIRPDAERYGICRICPPPGWKPQFAHKPDKLKFATKEQDLVSQQVSSSVVRPTGLFLRRSSCARTLSYCFSSRYFSLCVFCCD